MSIKIGDPQPDNCPKCKQKYGYMYSDTFRMHYTSVHDENGKLECGEYDSGRCLNRGIKAYCSNCGSLLPFKLIRKLGEEVKKKNNIIS